MLRDRAAPMPVNTMAKAKKTTCPGKVPQKVPRQSVGRSGSQTLNQLRNRVNTRLRGNCRASNSKMVRPMPPGSFPRRSSMLCSTTSTKMKQVYSTKVMLPKLWDQMEETLKETEIIGETPRPAFVFMEIPRARINSPRR